MTRRALLPGLALVLRLVMVLGSVLELVSHEPTEARHNFSDNVGG